MSKKPPNEAPREAKEKIFGQLTISIVGASPIAKIKVDNKGMNPYMVPTLLRQLAENFEEAIMKTKSLLET